MTRLRSGLSGLAVGTVALALAFVVEGQKWL